MNPTRHIQTLAPPGAPQRGAPQRAAPRRRGGAGLSIVEAAVSVVIVAVLLVAALQTLGAAARARVVQARQCQAPALARRLMAEIRQARYADETAPDGPLGPEAGEANSKDRSLLDDVDDYNGLVESSPRARDGSPLPGAGNWQRHVTVEWVRPDDPATVVSKDLGLKRITVTVTGPGPTVTLVALRSRYSGYEQVPYARTTYVAGVNVELKTSSDRLYNGVNLSNQVALP